MHPAAPIAVIFLVTAACDARDTRPGSSTGPRVATAPSAPAVGAQPQQPVPSSPSPPVSVMPGRTAHALVLKCAVGTVAGRFEITYTATNGAPDDAYLLDLSTTPRADKTDFDVEVRPIYLAWLGRSTAHLVQGIAPLPPDRDLYGRAIPFGTRLASGASITRTVTLPSPLAEFGPYDAPAPASANAPTIERLVVTLAALRSSAPGFAAEAMRGHPGVFRVSSKNTVGEVDRLRCELPVPKTELRIFQWVDGRVSFARAE